MLKLMQKTDIYDTAVVIVCVCVCECVAGMVGSGVGVMLGVGCPCLPIRNNIVTPHHLFCLYTVYGHECGK